MTGIVYGTNSQWYERSMGRMVHGTNGLHVVRIVRGTNSQWYKSLVIFLGFSLNSFLPLLPFPSLYLPDPSLIFPFLRSRAP